MRDHIFISYSHKDKRWLELLQTALKPVLSDIPCVLWDDTKIKAGTDWRKEINNALASAKVAVLLVSPDYLASDFVAKHELPPLLDAKENGGLTILWIAIRSSSYEFTEIERYKALNDPNKPLAALRKEKREEELHKISQQIALASNQNSMETKPEKSANILVVHIDSAEITIKGEHIASRAKIQQIIEDYFDVNSCFVRQEELERMFKQIRHGDHIRLQGPQGAGKTALLKQIQLLCLKNNIPIRYIDFNTIEGQFQTTLWRNVVWVLTDADPGIIKPDEVEARLGSESLLQQAVICLDNVDVLVNNPRISIEQEMVHLRSLVQLLRAHHKTTLLVILAIHDDFNVREHNSGFGSPWFTMYSGLISLAELSEQRSWRLLHLAGITDTTQVAFCLNKARYWLPLDLLVLAYLLKEYTTSNSIDYEGIESTYLLIEPLLRT